MRNKKKYNHYPMLYITQPKLEAPEASMQSGYRSQKKEQALNEPVDQSADGAVTIPKKTGGKQKFRDMSVQEKVQYFVNLPSQVPKMKCEIVTESENYRGLIKECQDGIVYINAATPPYKRKVRLSEILDINLLGF